MLFRSPVEDAAPDAPPNAEEGLQLPEADVDSTPKDGGQETGGPVPLETLPVTFWADLVSAVRKWRPSLGSCFNTNEPRFLSPALRGDLLELTALSEYVKNVCDHAEIRDHVAQQASALLRRPVRVRIVLRDSRGGAEDPMRRLVDLARAHPDVIHITE